MSDLIERQAAIDAFDGVKVNEEDCTEYDIGYNDGIDFAVSRLSVLPSAQPGEWLENYVSAILQAGLEGREVSFKVSDRTFAVRELNDER